MAFKLRDQISKVEVELEGTAEEIVTCKPGGYVKDAEGEPWYILSVDTNARTIRVRGTVVSRSFAVPERR